MIDPDLHEYLSEYQLQPPAAEPISHYEDGELEAQWLVASGFPELTKAFEEGRELPTSELLPILSGLPKTHADAVKQRVRALNRTVRGRTRSRYGRKPDIRELFPEIDTSSTGTRSRSATPDSLDSIPGDEHWQNANSPNFLSVFEQPNSQRLIKQNLRRTPSAPLRGHVDLFRGCHVRCDIPFYSADGIELLGFQRIGTIHIPRVRSGSDPSCSLGRTNKLLSGARSANNLYNNQSDGSGSSSPEQSPSNSPPRCSLIDTSCRPSEPISFESMIKGASADSNWSSYALEEPCSDIDDLSEADLKKLQPLLWLELASLFDKYKVTFDKRKPFKRKRKEEGNVFGVSLNALVRRDQQVTGEDSSLVPLVLQKILKQLMTRGAKEQGILRIAGHKQKTETLYNEVEQYFYSKPEKIEPLLEKAGIHDISALLKRWLRELPQPLLTNELVHLFYQTNALPAVDQFKAITVLCLLLPHENRNTVRALMKFLKELTGLVEFNKMTIHNVATIIAPSLFPPRFVHPDDKNDITAQVGMAAKCTQLANIIIAQSENLWRVPLRLLNQAHKAGQSKRNASRKSRMNLNTSEIIRVNPSQNHVQRIAI